MCCQNVSRRDRFSRKYVVRLLSVYFGVVIFGDRVYSTSLFFLSSFLFHLGFSGLVMCEYRVPFFEEIPRSKVKLPVALSSVSLAKKQ